MAAMNAQEMTRKHCCAVPMAAQVLTIFHMFLCWDLELIKTFDIDSKLYLGRMECMGNMLCDMWWWYTWQKQSEDSRG